MTEASDNVRDTAKPRGWFAPVVSSVIVLLVAGAFTTLWTAPQEQSARADSRIEERLDRDEADARELAQRVGELELKVKELGIKVEQGIGDRYTGTQAKDRAVVVDERNQERKEEIAELREFDQRIWDFLLKYERVGAE